MRNISALLALFFLYNTARAEVIDYGPVQDSQGHALVDIYDNSGNERGTASFPFRCDPTGTTAQPVTGTFWQTTQPVSVASLPLPAGAATSALQTTGNSSLTTINSTLGSPFQAGGSIGNTAFASTQSGTWSVGVNNFPATQAISAAALPLPSGASTSALQTTGNTSLATIASNTPAVGQALMAASSPVVIASNQSAIPVTGTFFQATQPVSGTFFQATQPVSGTFWQATQPISAAALPLPTGAATAAGLTTINTTLGSPFQAGASIGNTAFGATQSGTWTVGVNNFPATQAISAAALPLPTGAATSAKQPAFGTAGTPSTDVLTVQGAASMTALKVDGSGVTQPVSGSLGRSWTLSAGTDSVTVGVTSIAAGTTTIGAVAPVDGFKATYGAATTNTFTAVATPTDICTITGSASKTIRVLRVAIQGTQTTGGYETFGFVKRSTANTGGTSAALTGVPYDSNDAAATATVLQYTANPTALGTAVGTIGSYRTYIPVSATGTGGTQLPPAFYTFSDLPAKAVVLRGTSQVLAINGNSTTMAGNVLTCLFVWTEE